MAFRERTIEPETWHRALQSASALNQATAAFRAHPSEALALLSAGLNDGAQARRTLLLLSYLDPGYIVALADRLVYCAERHRDALLVRQIFGRLRHDHAEDLVPLAVWRHLGDREDDEAYRRMAELLYHLGLTDALRQITRRALASEDPNMRDVGLEFTPDEDQAGPGSVRTR
jgi:hypothetical protein